MITDEQRRELRREIVEAIRPTLRKEIGDRLPAQYDKADRIVEALARAIDRGVEKVNTDVSTDVHSS